mmetsp:Transcript_29034/g.76764  ORF Transcript_29034/g.76764 Transcript_29034/m.76764 type:complete len:129 (+) Transcript_29034:306-692(+)
MAFKSCCLCAAEASAGLSALENTEANLPPRVVRGAASRGGPHPLLPEGAAAVARAAGLGDRLRADSFDLDLLSQGCASACEALGRACSSTVRRYRTKSWAQGVSHSNLSLKSGLPSWDFWATSLSEPT